MTTPLVTLDRRRVFGSLNTGRDVSALAMDECPVMRNVEHAKAGAVTKRLGRALTYEICTHPEVTDTPLIVGVDDPDGELVPETVYQFKFTHNTVVGETDDIGAEDWGPSLAVGQNAFDVHLPFHMRKVTIDRFYKVDSATPGLPPNPGLPFTYMIGASPTLPLSVWALADPDAFTGFLLYSRAPRIQDETKLGANYLAETPLYDRLSPLAKVYSIGEWDGGDVFVLDRSIPQIGQMGKIDRDTADIMLDDRCGLPIKYVNVYMREQGSGSGAWRLAGVIWDALTPLRVLAVPTTGLPPSLRIDRTAPTVAAVTLRDEEPGVCGSVLGNTGIAGGVYCIHHTWTTLHGGYLNDAGWALAWEGANIGECRPHRRCAQEAWPSQQATLVVADGQGISITRPDLPDYVDSWNAYIGAAPVIQTKDWADAEFNPQTQSPFGIPLPAAEYSGKASLSAAVVAAAITEAQVDTSPVTSATSAFYDQFQATSIILDDAEDPFLPTTRGFRPGYPDINRTLVSGVEQFLYASSRDDVPNNRHIYWQFWDTTNPVDVAALTSATHGILRVTVRIRPGLVTSFDPNDDEHVTIRVWNDSTSTLETLRANIGRTDGAFVHLSLPFAWDTSRTRLVGALRYLGFDIKAIKGVGYDVDRISLDLVNANGACDAVIERRDVTDDSITVRTPLATTAGTNERMRQNNTAMAPVNLPRPEMRWGCGCGGNSCFPAGAADSVFLVEPNSGVRRIYQYEGIEMAEVCAYDWRFTAYYGRLFLNNAGRGGEDASNFNLRFDGRQTFPMGIDFPHERGEVVSVNDPPPGPGVTENFPIEYYAVYRRTLEARNRGHVVRSAPGQKLDPNDKVLAFTDTERVNVKDDVDTSLLVEATMKPEPQVGYIEFYRNKVFTADYYREDTLTIPIEEAVVNADGSVNVSWTDIFDAIDGDLDLPIEFETGRPTSALFAVMNQARWFFVQRRDPAVVAFSNVTSPSGTVNPEGFYAHHVVEPDIPAPLTCLSPYGDSVVASSNGGMVPIAGISDDQNSAEALSFGGSFADTGWTGPDAYVNVNSAQYGMTQLGPGRLQGQEMDFIGHNVRGVIERFQFTPDQRASMRCLQNTALQRTQVWFTLPPGPSACMDEVLILDEESLPEGIRHYWAQWTEMDCHGVTVQKDATRKDAVWVAGQRGRIFLFGGRFQTDAGLFIDAQADTKPITEAEVGKTFGPRWLSAFIHGNPLDTLLIDYRKDFLRRPNVNTIAIRVKCNDIPQGMEPIGTFAMGGGAVWGLEDQRLEIERRRNLGQVAHQIQFCIKQLLTEMPVGSRREATFQSAGYVLSVFPRGQRRTR